MKRILILLVIIFGFAPLAWGEPPVRQVEVVNDPLDADFSRPADVEVTGEPSITRSVQDTESNPVPVVYPNSQVCEKEYFTAYVYLPDRSTTTILEIPEGKRALISDIVFGLQAPVIKLLAGGNTFLWFRTDQVPTVAINATSGLVTPPGARTLEVTNEDYGGFPITIAGYFIPE